MRFPARWSHYVAIEKKQAGRYRRILLSKRQSALAALGAKAQVLAQPERICEEDQAQYSLEEAVSLRLNGLDYARLRRIEEALDRLQQGEYGICAACEEAIPAKRLEALPWARYCVRCQEAIAEQAPEAEAYVYATAP